MGEGDESGWMEFGVRVDGVGDGILVTPFGERYVVEDVGE